MRAEGGFVGERDRLTGEPLPDHISAKSNDLPALVEGMVAFDNRSSGGGSDPVIAAAVLLFLPSASFTSIPLLTETVAYIAG